MKTFQTLKFAGIRRFAHLVQAGSGTLSSEDHGFGQTGR
jgi:hypothetical protein